LFLEEDIAAVNSEANSKSLNIKEKLCAILLKTWLGMSTMIESCKLYVDRRLERSSLDYDGGCAQLERKIQR